MFFETAAWERPLTRGMVDFRMGERFRRAGLVDPPRMGTKSSGYLEASQLPMWFSWMVAFICRPNILRRAITRSFDLETYSPDIPEWVPPIT